MSLSLDSPLSLYSIPAAWFTAFYPGTLKFLLIDRTMGYNNLQPRANTKRIAEDPAVPKEVVKRVQRLEGAHLNGNEVLPLWIGAVLAGNLAGVSNRTLNIASAGFIASRLLYNYIYITQSTIRASWTRTAVFFAGLGFPLYLLVKAGNILRNVH